MVNVLYAVAAFTCALVSLILPVKVKDKLKNGNKVERSFYKLIRWTAMFCIADGMWGIAASELVMNDALLFILSTVFHTLASLTPAVWLGFVITYLNYDSQHIKIFRGAMLAIITTELILIGINLFQKMMFYVDADGIYCSTPVRKLLFYLQYATYVLIAVIALVNLMREKASTQKKPDHIERHDHFAVLIFDASPIFSGIFQMLYPDAPAYSIGYSLGVCVIYSFILTDMLQKQMMESIRAEAANEAKTNFLFNMSHDIRTPMNAIMGFTNIAKKNLDNRERLSDCLDKIQNSGNLLLSLINGILDVSRIESGKAKLNLENADVRLSFENLHATLEEVASGKGIRLSFEMGRITDPYVLVDRDRCNRIFVNIITNGIKYTKAGGYVRSRCEQVGKDEKGYGLYRYTFEDNGIGMSEEFQKHIFEEFSREENTTVSGIQGTGLGLSVCKSFVDLMGGAIKCSSKRGVGTTFIVTLPFKIREGDGNSKVSAAGERTDQPINFRGKRVLLAEDNALNREIALDILGEEEMLVETAENGAAAVALLREKGPDYFDFILMDIQMPVMNGYEATAEIRKLYPDLKGPIIALSANAFSEDREASAAAGMDDHIAKPIDVKILFATLAKFL